MVPHLTWQTALAPLAWLAARARTRFPGVPPWLLAVAAVLASWAAGYIGSRALAWAGRIALAAAGVGVAYFVLR